MRSRRRLDGRVTRLMERPTLRFIAFGVLLCLLLVYTIVAIAFSGADALPLLIGEFILTSYAGLLICRRRQIKLSCALSPP